MKLSKCKVANEKYKTYKSQEILRIRYVSVILRYKKPLEVVDEHLSEHWTFMDDCYRNKILVASGPQIPRIGGVWISQLKDRAEVESTLKRDPFYIHQVADYEVLEFNPTRYHSDFEPFINEGE